jgi:hypothetical protein
MLPNLGSVRQEQVTEMRIDRVLDIRCKIKSGEYSLAERLDLVIDRLLADIQQ